MWKYSNILFTMALTSVGRISALVWSALCYICNTSAVLPFKLWNSTTLVWSLFSGVSIELKQAPASNLLWFDRSTVRVTYFPVLLKSVAWWKGTRHLLQLVHILFDHVKTLPHAVLSLRLYNPWIERNCVFCSALKMEASCSTKVYASNLIYASLFPHQNQSIHFLHYWKYISFYFHDLFRVNHFTIFFPKSVCILHMVNWSFI